MEAPDEEKINIERVRFQIDCDIHYLQCKLPQDSDLILKASIGKSFQKSTPSVLYSSSTAHAFFDSKLTGKLTLHKQGSKYKKKSLKLQIFSKSQELGKVAIELSQIPSLKKPIKNREIQLSILQDPSALISISIALTPSSSKSSKKSEKTQKKAEEFELESCGNESFSSKMSFSDFIINPNEADMDKESTSSEEEYKELSADMLNSLNTPKLEKELVTPNENSKAYIINEIEMKNGINPTRQKGNCVNCVVF